jgi:hypothetical protein
MIRSGESTPGEHTGVEMKDSRGVVARFEAHMQETKNLVEELKDEKYECWISKEQWNDRVSFKVTAPVLERTLK